MFFKSFALAIIIFIPLVVSKPVQAQQNIETDSCADNAGYNFGDCLSRSIPEGAATFPVDRGLGLAGSILGCTGQYVYRVVQCPPSNSQNSHLSRNDIYNSGNEFDEGVGGYSSNPYFFDEGYSQDPYSFDGNDDGVVDGSYNPYSF